MSHILMLCHDQHLDRRVVAQASSLIAAHHQVTLLALSYHAESETSVTPEGIQLIRIGLNEIIPTNAIYQGYLARQLYFNSVLNKLCNRNNKCRAVRNLGFQWASRINWMWYRLRLLLRYRNRQMHDPLPFTAAFLQAGRKLSADIVQVHDLPALEAGVLLAEEWNVPLIYDAHELYPEQRSFSKVQKKLCSKMEAKWINRAKHVFAVNESIAEVMAKRYAILKPSSLSNALDPHEGFDPNQSYDLLRQNLQLPANRRILLFQGGFAPNRNLEALVRAMRFVQTDQVDLVMMGFGDFGEKLKAIASKHKLLGKRVYFHPAVSHEELLQHSASADIGIIPYPHVDLNSYYCTPNKLFEFIQAGLPILANDSPELRRFVADTGFGMVKPLHCSRQIAKAIDEAFTHFDFDKTKSNLQQKRSEFSWQVQSKIYLDVMLPLLEKGEHRTDQEEKV